MAWIARVRRSYAPDARGDGPMTVASLDATAIGKRFGRRVVLDGASVSVRAGEAVALVGEKGAGKSTLLRICTGLIAPDSGNVAAHEFLVMPSGGWDRPWLLGLAVKCSA